MKVATSETDPNLIRISGKLGDKFEDGLNQCTLIYSRLKELERGSKRVYKIEDSFDMQLAVAIKSMLKNGAE